MLNAGEKAENWKDQEVGSVVVNDVSASSTFVDLAMSDLGRDWEGPLLHTLESNSNVCCQRCYGCSLNRDLKVDTSFKVSVLSNVKGAILPSKTSFAQLVGYGCDTKRLAKNQ